MLILVSISQQGFAESNNTAYLLRINGPIGPATQEYVNEGVATAIEDNASLIIFEIDTPGGLAKSMRGIIKTILAAPVPTVGYVAPAGARAASAGTFLIYACNIAVMAPGTNLGAATPVNIMTGRSSQPQDNKKSSKANAMSSKILNDAIAYIESLAELRGRNADWAKKAVTEGASLSAKKALKINVINLISNNLPNLLTAINGKQVSVNQQTVTIDSKNIVLKTYLPNWRSKLLSIITNPNVAYILMLLGIYGLFFEFANPGFIVPGVAGAISLIIALYAFHLLPISYAGLGLMLVGIILLVSEAFVPSFGALGLGGIIAFVIGSIFLIKADLQAFQIHWQIITAMTIVNAAFFFGIIGMAIRSTKRKVVSGSEGLIGSQGYALKNFETKGWVMVNGERWQAISDTPMEQNQKVLVSKVDGLVLHVTPLEK